MNDVVQPESVDPLVLQDDVRFSNLVVDIVQGMDTLYHVMYISTGQWRKGWGEARQLSASICSCSSFSPNIRIWDHFEGSGHAQ